MAILKTIYEDEELEQAQFLEEIKWRRRIGKQKYIFDKCQLATNLVAPHFNRLETIYEEENAPKRQKINKIFQPNVFKKSFLGWLSRRQQRGRRFCSPTKTPFIFPSLEIQETTGHGASCAYCDSDFVHAAKNQAAPVYITICGHIVCAFCVLNKSRPCVPNLSPLLRQKYPYVLSSEGTACPACNVEFARHQIYHFYN